MRTQKIMIVICFVLASCAMSMLTKPSIELSAYATEGDGRASGLCYANPTKDCITASGNIMAGYVWKKDNESE